MQKFTNILAQLNLYLNIFIIIFNALLTSKFYIYKLYARKKVEKKHET